MMFTRDRKYFRFQFLALPLLLLISTTQAVSVPKGCAEVASTWMKNMELASIVQDTDSLNNLLDCFQGMYKLIEGANWKTVQDNIPKGVKDLVQKIPNLMDKAKSFTASKGELVFWSVYLGFRSIELYDRATQLKITVKKHRQEFDLLKVKLKSIKDFLDTEIVLQWKNGNIAIVPKNTEKLIKKLSGYSDVLTKLVEVIYNDCKQGSSDRIWSAAYGVAGVGVCAGSFFSRNPGVRVAVCGIGLGTAAFNVQSFFFLGESLQKLDLLWDDAAQMRTEITKYYAILAGRKLRGDFYL